MRLPHITNPLKILSREHKPKSPEELAPMRHTLAHLLAAAVLELWPDAKRTIGPAIDNGFYYDFEFPTSLELRGASTKPITDSDLPKIESKMRELLPSWVKFEKHE